MMVKFHQVDEENLLQAKEFEEGSVYFCIDTKRLFMDPIGESTRILIGGDPIVLFTEADKDNILAPIPNKIYYVSSSNSYYIYNNGVWNQVNGGSSSIDIDKTLSQSGKAADAAAVGNAINNKANNSGWSANKYLGTDAEGNIIEKDAPSTSSNISVVDSVLFIKSSTASVINETLIL